MSRKTHIYLNYRDYSNGLVGFHITRKCERSLKIVELYNKSTVTNCDQIWEEEYIINFTHCYNERIFWTQNTMFKISEQNNGQDYRVMPVSKVDFYCGCLVEVEGSTYLVVTSNYGDYGYLALKVTVTKDPVTGRNVLSM